MVSSSLEFSLSLKPSYVPKTITKLLNDLSKIDNFSDRLLVLNDYLHKHQEELSKVEAFRRELPQCMLLLMDAIETLKGEVVNIKNGRVCDHDQNIEKPLMEFLSTKRCYSELHEQRESFEKYCRERKNVCFGPSSDQICELNVNNGEKKQKTALDPSTIQACKGRDGRHSILTRKGLGDSSSMIVAKEPGKEVEGGPGYGGLNLRGNGDQPLNFKGKALSNSVWRNCRRSWTPELHARFLGALEVLGGPQVATPKLIRDIMKVEGLTNDQVKSHLQKYRLHIRRAPAANADLQEHAEKFQEPLISEFHYDSP